MKKILFSLLLMVAANNIGFGQKVEIQLQTGVSAFRLNFPGFQSYLSSYNTQNAGSDMIDSARFNKFGVGYHVGGIFRIGGFIAGIDMGKTTGFKSTATYTYDQSRSFQFKNYYFDLQIGGRIGGSKFAFCPYLTMTLNTLNLYTFYSYDKVKSYGGERSLSGVYTSWRLLGRAGGRFEYRFTNRIAAFADLSFTLNKSEYLGGDFSESNSATDSNYFQAYATQDQLDAITNGLKEIYRVTRGVFGLQLNLGGHEDED